MSDLEATRVLRLEGLTIALHARVDASGLLIIDGGQLTTVTSSALPGAVQLALVVLLSIPEGALLSQSIQVRAVTPAAGVEVVATVPFMLDNEPVYINGRGRVTQIYNLAIPLPAEGVYRISVSDGHGLLGETEFAVHASQPH